jgi:hypothetical protein
MHTKLESARLVPISRALPHRGIDADLVGVRPGAHVLQSEWDALFSEGRLRTRAMAVASRRRTADGAYSHATAAALHRLPLYRVRSDRVDVTARGRHPRRNGADIVRHHAPLPEVDVIVIDRVRVTSLDRTVYDVIRTVSLEAAVTCFDAALRAVAWDDRNNTYDTEAAGRFRSLVVTRIRRAKGARGIRRARFVSEFADGRAQLPGESISRLWMWQLGVPEPDLQYRVDFDDGTYALLDFAWPLLRRWAEFDGQIKYEDADMLGGRSVEDVLARQASREHKVRVATGWDCDRWGFARMPNLGEFAKHLRSIGLYGT